MLLPCSISHGWRALSLLLLAVGVLAQNLNVPICYYPDESVAGGNYACNLAANVSACCGVGSTCLDNGLCGSGSQGIIRGACTDRSWGSPDCPQYCLGM